MSTAERLQAYYNFDEDVLAAVEDAAERQNRQSYTELADAYGLADGPLLSRPLPDTHRKLEYLDLRPAVEYDETHARLLFAPLGIAVDENMAMRAMRLFGTQPVERLVVVGSPALLGNRNNLLRFSDLPGTAAGNLSHTVWLALRQLQDDGVRTLDTLGYSYGADRAATAASEAANFEIEAERGVWAESPAVANRGLKLLTDFARSGKVLDDYVNAAQSDPLIEARKIAHKGSARYWAGMARVGNLATAITLARDSFSGRALAALQEQPGMRATVAWGTASEITDNDRMEQIAHDLQTAFPGRVGALALEGMHHAGGDDIDLHAAIMLQGLKV
ncbi:MAG: hypothetical protein JWN82_200 [Candidatus Saccharibacteria bacterium]|nr:hypothetical protein [Candidatus Saccharibacteria bacterium]